MGKKIPESVLVLIHSPSLEVLLLERADHSGFWQSVTGSRDSYEEPLSQTAARELAEETGIVISPTSSSSIIDWNFQQVYEIYPHWRHRYPEGITENVEHVFSVCVDRTTPITLAPREHTRYQWLPWSAAAELCFSDSNASAIRALPERFRA